MGPLRGADTDHTRPRTHPTRPQETPDHRIRPHGTPIHGGAPRAGFGSRVVAPRHGCRPHEAPNSPHPTTRGHALGGGDPIYAGSVRIRPEQLPPCPTCGDPLSFEILDDERFLVAWSCLGCGLIRTTEPV
ncbi:hypothetical protein GCM10010462_01680 [Microbacterium dextranolyticum]|uniref:Uncharacterized protein n=1 Tax=Microbacterium dextranolyticum TaxID=36806 RepID=A0A9W6HLP5_9MICO|nr:hypothetical protein GCM10017591_16330 [Microbacterium dextranolyticum]